MGSFELVVESRDVYTYHAVTWYIGQKDEVESALVSVVNARETSPAVLTLARGHGRLENDGVWYSCEESGDAYCTDTRPEPWRRVILRGANRESVCSVVRKALVEYKEHIASTKANDGIVLYSWDDHDGWLSVGDAPRRSMESLLLADSSGLSLLDDLRQFMSPATIERYIALNIPLIKIIMFHGVPGSGKTSCVRCIASELGLNVANFSGNDVQSFSDALLHAPAKCLVSVEDIDCMLGTSENQREKRGFSQLLNALDAVARKEPLIVCITTNFPGGLDIAVRRRIDHCLEFKWATKSQGIRLIKRFFDKFEESEKLWDHVTSHGRRSITMAMLQKFLIRSLKYGSPWELLEDDAGAFQSLYDVVTTDSVTHHIFT